MTSKEELLFADTEEILRFFLLLLNIKYSKLFLGVAMRIFWSVIEQKVLHYSYKFLRPDEHLKKISSRRNNL